MSSPRLPVFFISFPCLDGLNFAFSSLPACLCDPRGLDLDCDPLFGSCYCLPNVDGELCDRCSPGFFNITAGVGCSECNCNPIRAVDANCDQVCSDVLSACNVDEDFLHWKPFSYVAF